MAGFLAACKNTASCYLISLGSQSLISRLAARDNLTEGELVEAAVAAYLAANPDP